MPPSLSLVLIGIVLQAAFIQCDRSRRYGLAAVLKGLASFAFVLLGLWGALKGGQAGGASMASSLVCLGLACGAVGDVLHALRFVQPVKRVATHLFMSGAVSFFLGHVAYLGALVPPCPMPGIPLLLAAVAVAVVFAVLGPRIRLRGTRRASGVAYLGAVVCVASFAIVGFLSQPSPSRLAFALGGMLFAVSDTLLSINSFGGGSTTGRRVVSLSTYYVAQLLIAGSLWL